MKMSSYSKLTILHKYPAQPLRGMQCTEMGVHTQIGCQMRSKYWQSLHNHNDHETQ